MKGRKKILIFMLVVLVTYIFYSYGKVEYLTYKYGSEFKELESKVYTSYGLKSKYLKVFEYSSNKSELYYVGDDIRYMIVFQKNNKKWEQVDEHSVWSSGGSADEVVWPYYK